MENNKSFWQAKSVTRGVVAVIWLLAVFLVVLSLNGLRTYSYIGEDVANRRTISVSGEGEAVAVPDIARFTVSVTKQGATVADAQSKSAEIINEVIDFLKESGVEEKDIKTVGYNAYPRYEYRQDRTSNFYPIPPGGNRVLVGFEVSQSIEVRVRNIEEAGKLLSGAGELGVTNVSGVSLEVDDQEAVVSEAREKAISDAKEKAEILADQLGVRLGDIVAYNEGGSFPIARFETAMDGGIGGGTAPQIPAGENTVTSRVTLIYEIK